MKKMIMAACLAFGLGVAQAGDIEAGKKLAEAQCAACHAVNGDWNNPTDPTYPKLAGQKEDYLVAVLRHYQTGTRKNAIMAGMSAGLSPADIRNVSAFLADLEGDLYMRK